MIRGFTVESEAHKKFGRMIEDSYDFDKNKKAVAAADGVTRDPSEILPDLSTESGKIEFTKNYPNPSPAKIAADIFTKVFVKSVKPSEAGIKDSFEKANQEIMRWNQENIQKVNYLLNDFAGTVAAGAVVQGDKYFYGFICDCGVAVFDKHGKLRLITGDEGPGKSDISYAIKKTSEDEKVNWQMPEGRVLVRKHFRNRPSKPNTYGVLTGEKQAMKYVKVGSGNLEPGDILIVYSDDSRPIITSKEFSVLIKKKSLDRLKGLLKEKVNNEGTLVFYVH